MEAALQEARVRDAQKQLDLFDKNGITEVTIKYLTIEQLTGLGVPIGIALFMKAKFDNYQPKESSKVYSKPKEISQERFEESSQSKSKLVSKIIQDFEQSEKANKSKIKQIDEDREAAKSNKLPSKSEFSVALTFKNSNKLDEEDRAASFSSLEGQNIKEDREYRVDRSKSYHEDTRKELKKEKLESRSVSPIDSPIKSAKSSVRFETSSSSTSKIKATDEYDTATQSDYSAPRPKPRTKAIKSNNDSSQLRTRITSPSPTSHSQTPKTKKGSRAAPNSTRSRLRSPVTTCLTTLHKLV